MLCATFCDEDGIYDPAQFNDRLLLGLKGTMSEAELHVLKARLQGGIRNKARRGELELPLPIGLVYTDEAAVAFDPDQQIRSAVQLVFDTFRRSGSACAVVRRFRSAGLLFPRRVYRGVGKGDVFVGAARLLPGAADPAQPALCWGVRLWAHVRRAQRQLEAGAAQSRARALAGADS